MWFAGVDWADTHHDVLVIDETSRQVGSCRVTHTVEGLTQIKVPIRSFLSVASQT